MKKIGLSLLAIVMVFMLQAQDIAEVESKAISKVIKDAYIDGAFNNGDVSALKKGIHYDCDILILENGKFRKTPAYSYVERLEKDPKPLYPGTKCKFINIHVTGYAAVAELEIIRDNNKLHYTDYLSLYKFEDGWKIVSRIAYRHPDISENVKKITN